MARVLYRYAWVGHGNCVQRSIIVFPISIPAPMNNHKSLSSLQLKFYIINFAKIIDKRNNTPVPYVWRRRIRWVPPLAHLQDSNEEQRVDSEHTRRHRHAHYLSCSLSCIAEVECVRKCMKIGVQFERALDCEVRQDPITGCKWTRIPQKQIDKPRNSLLSPSHLKVIKPEIIVVLKPFEVKPVIEDDSYATELQQANWFHGPPICRPEMAVL